MRCWNCLGHLSHIHRHHALHFALQRTQLEDEWRDVAVQSSLWGGCSHRSACADVVTDDLPLVKLSTDCQIKHFHYEIIISLFTPCSPFPRPPRLKEDKLDSSPDLPQSEGLFPSGHHDLVNIVVFDWLCILQRNRSRLVPSLKKRKRKKKNSPALQSLNYFPCVDLSVCFEFRDSKLLRLNIHQQNH